MKKQGMPSRGVPRGGGKKSNVVSIKTKKQLTPNQVKARAAKQKASETVDKLKKSPMAEDMRKGNLDNFNKIVRNKPKRVNNSVFGPIAAGKVKPKPKPRGK